MSKKIKDMTREELQNMLDSYAQEVMHIKEWMIDRNTQLQSIKGLGGKVGLKSGHLTSIRTKESCSKGGKIAGKIAVESGQLVSIRGKGGKIGGPISGRIAVESGQISALGKKQGKLNRKLTYEDAQMIRDLYSKKKYNQKQLGEMYGVGQAVISLIISNKRYNEN